ncbi:MAG TPA: Slp family lipoprotein [Syntrophales bacterium]|nr:Slp family lipoprotein [Syntrophales bacterium]
MRRNRIFLMLICATFLCSCAPFSREIIRQSDEVLTVRDVQQSPEKYAGRMVLWGGSILETINQKSETVLRILKFDLDMQKKPARSDKPEGRFEIRYPGFLDPAIYESGRLVTVAGKIEGISTAPLGEIKYGYPVVRAVEIRLWEKIDPARIPPYWYDPFWGPRPYWDRYPYHPFYW